MCKKPNHSAPFFKKKKCFAQSHVANSDRITESLLKLVAVQVQPPRDSRVSSQMFARWHRIMKDWAVVVGLSWVAWMRGVYYLELQDTYFLRVHKKQTNEAWPNVLYTKILFASCLPHVRLVAHRNICSTASYTQRLSPVVRSLAPSALCLYRHVRT